MISVDIPAEKRWEIAAKSATAMPYVYDIFFRKAFGNKVDEIELPMWVEAGKVEKSLAKMLGLQARNAEEAGLTHVIISTILFGPEFKGETIEAKEEKITFKTTGCPFLNRSREMSLDPKDSFEYCQTYCRSAIENLNPKYTHRFTTAMCKGDPYCESIVELRKQ